MFTLPDLGYGYDALEPYIDAQTMELHHSKHHQTYIDKLNAAVEGTEWADKAIEDILQNINALPADKQQIVRNNGGGHWNHTFFWQCMAPSSGGLPNGKLHDDLVETFGSFEAFKTAFSDAAVGRFGSGWAWLIKKDSKLEIISTPNQDSPIMEGIEPLLGVDVWEHAYYLKYQNRRPEYIENFWNVVNWDFVSGRI
jgi:superoxide dismutase, Fe-Mn family